MRTKYRVSKGLNLRLSGAAPLDPSDIATESRCSSCAITPDDFPGFEPKAAVKEGDLVGAGAPLLFHKADPEVKLTAPCGGRVSAVVRGERRKIVRVVVEPAEGPEAVTFATPDKDASAEEIASLMKASGLWAMMRRRPFDTIPLAGDEPRDIFVNAMDTAPLATDPTAAGGFDKRQLETAVAALRKLTKGNVYICVAEGANFVDVAGARMCEFTRLHPAGLVGTQIDAIAPINKGETVWTLNLDTLVRLGRLLVTGKLDNKVVCTVCGPALKTPRVVRAFIGEDVRDLLAAEKEIPANVRIISGNVLTGVQVGEDGYLRYPYTQLTVIAESNDDAEFMGWASMSPSKLSVSSAFPSSYNKREFRPDARLNGGRRAMIMSEVYDKLIPIDIMPEFLIKAILARDIDRMEALGIYEVAPEDFALAEFADPSKLELQRIVREGLDFMRKETQG